MIEKEKTNNRITIALDDQTSNILDELKVNISGSQSGLIRKAIKFYYRFNKVFHQWENGMERKLKTYIELLSQGENIILDIDHYLSILKFIEESPEQDKFWKINKNIGKALAKEYYENLNILTIKNVIEHLETCNLFKILYESTNKFTLLLGSDIQRNFVKIFLEEILKEMGFNVIINEGFSKLIILPSENGKEA